MVENPNFPKDSIKTRKIAFLVADGFDDDAVSGMKQALMTAGAQALAVAPRLGVLTGAKGEECKADFSLLTGSSVLFDAVYVPGGDASVASLKGETEAVNFLNEAYNHCKAIAASGIGVDLLSGFVGEKSTDTNRSGEPVVANEGVVTSRGTATDAFTEAFIEAIAQHRHWERETNIRPAVLAAKRTSA